MPRSTIKIGRVTKLLCLISSGIFLCLTHASASLQLASARVGFSVYTWMDVFGFAMTQLSVTQGDSKTQVFTQLPSNIIQIGGGHYALDNAITVATTGTLLNGSININYTAYLFVGSPDNPRWAGSPVSASVTVPFINGQIPADFDSVSVNGNTRCELTPSTVSGTSFIQIYCSLSQPP